MSMEVKQSYSIRRRLSVPYEEAVDRAKAAFKGEGFGVLTEIDVRKTIQDKLGLSFRRYVILGMCNPQLAHRALETEIEIGLMLPCNVIIYEDNGASVVAAQNPEVAMKVINNPGLEHVAKEARERLERALNALA